MHHNQVPGCTTAALLPISFFINSPCHLSRQTQFDHLNYATLCSTSYKNCHQTYFFIAPYPSRAVILNAPNHFPPAALWEILTSWWSYSVMFSWHPRLRSLLSQPHICFLLYATHRSQIRISEAFLTWLQSEMHRQKHVRVRYGPTKTGWFSLLLCGLFKP